MVNSDGSIDFTGELMDVVGRALDACEWAHLGSLEGQQRVLAVSYLLGLIRSDLDTIWQAFDRINRCDGFSPDSVFEKCLSKDLPPNDAHVDRVGEDLVARGWASR